MADNWWEQDAVVAPQQGAVPGFIPGRPKAPDPLELQRMDLAERAAARADASASRAATAAERQAGAAERGQDSQVYNNLMKLRGDYDALPAVKQYRVAISQLATGLSTKDDATGDNALIYAYAKAMDPESVVRESEMDMAASGGSVIESTVAGLKKQFGIEGGGQLSPEIRRRMRREMGNKVAQLNRIYKAQRDRFTLDAQAFELDPARVIGPHDGDAFMQIIKDYQARERGTDSATPGSDDDYEMGFDAPDAPPPGGRRLTAEQEAELKAFAATKPSADALSGWFAAKGFGGLTPESARGIAAALAAGRPIGGVDYKLVDANTTTDAEALKVARDALQGPGGVTTLSQQGVTLGLSDELAGAGNAVMNTVLAPFTDEKFDPGAAYTAGRDAERMRIADARETTGGVGTAAEIISGVATMGLGSGGAATSTPSLLARIGSGARMGAGYGAAAGYGYGEGGFNSATGAAVGAGVGSLVGAALPLAGSAVTNRVQAMRRLAGRDNEIPTRLINAAIEADALTPRAAGAAMDAGRRRGSPMMLADMGENVRGLLASVSRQPGSSRTVARDAVISRQESQADRVSAAISRDLGPVANPYAAAEQLTTQARAAAAPLYEAAYARPGASSVQLDDLAERPAFRKALQNALNIAKEEGRDPTALGFTLAQDGSVELTRVPSFQTLDYVKRGMDDVIEGFRDKTSGALRLDTQGNAANRTLRTLIARMDRVNPDYRAARAAYAGPTRDKGALEQGLKALNKSADDISFETRRMGESELEMYRLGVRRAMTEVVEGQGDYADKINRLVGTPRKRAALARLFGGRRNFQQFIDTLGDERAAGLTYRSVAGNSQTAERLAQDAQTADTGLTETALDAALRGAKDGPWSAAINGILKLRDVGRFGHGEAGERARESIATLLTQTDPAELSGLLRAVQRAQARERVLARRAGRRVGAQGAQIGRGVGELVAPVEAERR